LVGVTELFSVNELTIKRIADHKGEQKSMPA